MGNAGANSVENKGAGLGYRELWWLTLVQNKKCLCLSSPEAEGKFFTQSVLQLVESLFLIKASATLNYGGKNGTSWV